MSESDRLYRALAQKDRSYDGKVFYAVRTTGIYCRPICPARTPLPENVAYFPTAAAAERAGFRACRRCRPETAPGSAAWRGTAALVDRAMRLLEAVEDVPSMPELAARLGVEARHLRRLFEKHVGRSPKEVTSAYRLAKARQLARGSTRPMTEIAFQSGFRSIRRFNDAYRRAYGTTPTADRKLKTEPSPRDVRTPRVRRPRRP